MSVISTLRAAARRLAETRMTSGFRRTSAAISGKRSNHLVRPAHHHQAEGLGGPEIDDQVEGRWALRPGAQDAPPQMPRATRVAGHLVASPPGG
jgi:hypothetical protein